MRMIIKAAITGVLLTVSAGISSADTKSIYAIFWEGCEHGCEGFLDGINASSLDANVIVKDAKQDKSLLSGFVAEARSLDVDLVLTYGTSVTLGVAGRISDIGNGNFIQERPLVFMQVSDPIGSEIAESFESSGRLNVTGTYNRVPESVNVEIMRLYNPKFETLGMLYNSNENNSVNKVAEMQALSDTSGFDLVALELELGVNELPIAGSIDQKMKELALAGVDFVYVGSSSFLRLNADEFGAAAAGNYLPTLSAYEEMVRENGALISVAAKGYEVGQVAANQVVKILLGGDTPIDLPIARVTNFAYVVNMNTAKEIEMFPPISLLQIAETVE